LHALIRLRVAIRLGAAHIAEQSAITCEQEGWSPDQVSATAAGYSETAFDEPQRLVLRFADDLTRTPMDVDLPTLRQLHLHFSNDQVVELAAAITPENYRTRFRTALELA
jgi:alkylhydroperoxidase family enzyme